MVLFYVWSGNNFFFLNERISICPVKPHIIVLRSTDINIVFSDIRHESKQSLIREEFRSVEPRC